MPESTYKEKKLTTASQKDGYVTDAKTDTHDRTDLQAWVYLVVVSF